MRFIGKLAVPFFAGIVNGKMPRHSSSAQQTAEAANLFLDFNKFHGAGIDPAN